jgi:hypothetical protein
MSKKFLAAISLSIIAISPALAQKQVLRAEETLQKGEYLETKSKIYRLVMQHDGNLVRYMYAADGSVRTTSYSTGVGNGEYLRMQQDGNAAIYTKSGTWAWNAKSGGNPSYLGYILVLRESGIVEILKESTTGGSSSVHKNLATIDGSGYDGGPVAYYPVYSNATCQQLLPLAYVNYLRAAQYRPSGSSMGYCGHRYN